MRGAGEGTRPSRSEGARLALVDAGLALALAALCFALYRATRQERTMGDAYSLIGIFAASTDRPSQWLHVLYFPAARLLFRLGAWSNPADCLWALSAIAGSAGVACSYLLARCFAGRAGSLLATALVALAPAQWFLATTVELHALHFGVVALAAWLTVVAFRWGTAAGAAASAVGFAFVYWSHQTGALLGIGWIALVQAAMARRGRAFGPWKLWLGIGSLLALSLLGAIVVAGWLRGGGVGFYAARQAYTQVTDTAQPFALGKMREMWISAQAALLVLGVAGACSRRIGRWPRIAAVAAFVPPFLFFSAWAIPERGAYSMGVAPFLALAAAHARLPWRTAGVAAAAVLIALQGVLGWRSLASHEDPELVAMSRARAAAVRELAGESAIVVSFEHELIGLARYVPGCIELRFLDAVLRHEREGESPEDFVASLSPWLRDFARQPGRELLLDRGYERQYAVAPFLRPYYERLEEHLRREYAVLESPATLPWPLWRARLVPEPDAESRAGR